MKENQPTHHGGLNWTFIITWTLIMLVWGLSVGVILLAIVSFLS